MNDLSNAVPSEQIHIARHRAVGVQLVEEISADIAAQIGNVS
jgi:hypothetical protein